MKKLKENKESLTEGLMDLIWKKLMKGKKADIINAFDNNPEVKKGIEDMQKANDKFRSTIERIQARQRKAGYDI